MENYLPTPYQEFLHLSRYARWLPEEKRRETWEETVDRLVDFFEEHLKENFDFELGKAKNRLRKGILNLQVVPSMRALWAAGPAASRDNVACYNCSALPIDRPASFDELFYILMNGCGVGFSVERQFINKLPEVSDSFHESDTTIVVSDSTIGWCKALKELIGMLYVGQVPRWDLSKIRPAGTPLKTKGGRASGGEILGQLFDFVVVIFKGASGRKLNSIECHDICCKIAEIVTVGGCRRSALLSLSNLSDLRMREAKVGRWWEESAQRAMANNSVAYTEKPDMGIFMEEWKSLYDSKSGERGIFNRESCKKIIEKIGRRDTDFEFLTNPCSEILLRPRGFCNLSEVILREDDTEETILEKIELATILGTIQSTFTNFRYLSKNWKKNAEEERLLGVSMTGIMDCPLTNDSVEGLEGRLERFKEKAIEINKKWAEKIGIKQSAAITCVKPSGNTSQLCDTASGIHARHSPYYIRTVRSDKKDPLTKLMIDKGFPYEDEINNPQNIAVFSFPIKAPEQSFFRNDKTALEQLELWKKYQLHYCEHKPSITVSVKEDEWLEVGAWVYKNFDLMSGVSFLPFSDHVYKQAPYQDCTKEQYEELLAKMPKTVDWSELSAYESSDMTTGARELACTAGGCEI